MATFDISLRQASGFDVRLLDTSDRVKSYHGGIWPTAPTKFWNGTEWKYVTVRIWDGAEWVE